MNAHQKIIKDNARTILKIITKYYGCKYSAALYVILKEHPDFPSFLSFQYILHRMGKDSFAIHTSYEELTNIPSPFIAHVITNVDLFLFITKVTAESIQTIDEKGKIESISRKDFEDMWDGNILIMDNRPGKISIPLKMKFSTIIKQIKYPMLILCVAILFAYLLILKHEGGILFYLYLTGVLGGLTASILLFVDQIDKYNVHIKKLCSATGNKNNIDCSSILDFKDAYFLGLVSWSDIGFVYFLSLLIVLLFLPFGKSIIEITTIFVTVTSIYIVIKPIIATQKEHTTLKRKYNELIYDENISQYLFQQELCLTDVDKVNKISIGNPDAEICLTLIFSPICVSCIKELQKLMPILQRKANTKLDLIFLLDQKKHPESIVIASHILSGYQKNPQLFAMILKKYVDNYPISKNKILHNIKFLDEIPKYEPFINAQEKWCITHKFYTTPILFINGRKFPSYYNIKDIDFLYS